MIIRVLVFFLLLAADQLTKVLAHTRLTEGSPVEIIPNVFNLTLVYNPGAAFGLFSGLPDTYRRIVLLGVAGVALVIVARFMIKDAKDDLLSQYALIAILAGAVGNIIDRIRFDKVVDFLDFYWGSYHWPAFNVADSAISIGVFILILRIIFAPAETRKLASCSRQEL